MRDHDVDLEGLGSPRHRDAKDTESGADRGPAEVGKAIEARRPDAIGAQGMLHLQRAAGNAGIASMMGQRKEDEESPVKEVVRSSGKPLDKGVREEMEGRFGADFSDVQIHTDGKAADSAKSVSAQAYTVGNHVVFGDGKYNPDSADGKHMIAHELTHVVQQRNGPVDGTPVGGGVKMSDPGDRFEREADQNARTLLSSPGPAPTSSGAAGVQRQEEEGDEEQAQGMHVQRQEEEEDSAQGMAIQRQEEEGDEEQAQGMALQAKSDEEEGKEEEKPADEKPAEEKPAGDEPGKEVAEEKPAETKEEEGKEEEKEEEAGQKMEIQREEEGAAQEEEGAA